MSSGRVFHSDSRTWSNFQPSELVKLCGVPQGRWPVYVIKELLDNAVAALEEHGKKLPMVRVTITDEYVEVMENGPGISDEVLDNILDFDRFGGSNRHHKLPTRGAQGNAFMTIMGIVSAWMDVGYVELYRPCGRSLRLQVNLDKVRQDVRIMRLPFGGPKPSAIRVPLPDEMPWKRGGSTMADIEQVVRQFAWMNPHVMFMITSNGRTWSVPITGGSKPAMDGAPKAGATSWFTQDEFAERMAADVRARPGMKLYDWMREFAFVRLSAATAQESDLPNRPIDVAVSDAERAYNFLVSTHDWKQAQDPGFNQVGAERLGEFLHKEMGADIDSGVEYHAIKGAFKGTGLQEVPYLVEVALLQMKDGARDAPEPILAMNRTILYGSPTFKAKDGFQYREKVRGQWRGVNGDLGSLARAYQIDHGKTPAAVVIHITCPSPGYSGYGKQQFDTAWLADDLSKCFEKVTLQVRRQRHGESRRKKANVIQRDTIREEMFRLIPGVLDEVTENGKYEPLIRQFFYSFRKEWYVRDDRELNYQTFCVYVGEYEENVAGRPVCLKDPRGTMYEPHGGRTLRLGTADVRDFKPKKWLGHTIIFVEKENLAAQMRQMKIDKRWDAIIIGSKGFAVEAIRDVLQKYRQLLGDVVKIVCLHDADPAGYMIGYDLATNLPRFGENVDVQVIDVGLTIKDAREMELQDEPFEIKKQNWSMINKTLRRLTLKDPGGRIRPVLDPEAYDAFMPHMYRGSEFPTWADSPKGRRVELNAMPPRQFEEWVESNLERHGCRKVRPPDEVVDERMKSARTNKITNSVGEMFMRLAGEEVVMEVFREIGVPSYDLDRVLEGRPEQHWEYLVTAAAQRGDDINGAVERVMKRRLPQLFEALS